MNKYNNDIETTFDELKKSSRISLTLVILGALALLAGLIYSGLVLKPLEEKIKVKSEKIEELVIKENELNEKIRIEKETYNSLKKRIESMNWEQVSLEKELSSLKKQLSSSKSVVKKLSSNDFKIIDSQNIPPCDGDGPRPVPVPFEYENGLKNLSLLRTAIAKSSSVLPGYPWRHRTEFLNDGWYNNCRSWIPASTDNDEYAEIDLGSIFEIHGIAFGSEHTPFYHDRAAIDFEVLTAIKEGEWNTVFSYNSPSDPIHRTRTFLFQNATQAQYVRLVIKKSIREAVRIDEFEILGKELESRRPF